MHNAIAKIPKNQYLSFYKYIWDLMNFTWIHIYKILSITIFKSIFDQLQTWNKFSFKCTGNHAPSKWKKLLLPQCLGRKFWTIIHDKTVQRERDKRGYKAHPKKLANLGSIWNMKWNVDSTKPEFYKKILN